MGNAEWGVGSEATCGMRTEYVPSTEYWVLRTEQHLIASSTNLTYDAGAFESLELDVMRTTISILFGCLFTLVTTEGLAQHWPQFRGQSGDGVAVSDSAAEKHPEAWSADEHLAWKAKIPGVGWSQPIVWGDRVFVTTAVADKQQRPKPDEWSPGDGVRGLSFFIGSMRKPPDAEYQWKVLCFDLKTGNMLWEQTAHAGKPVIPIHPNNTYATETPATDGERVVTSFGPEGIYCYDFSGKLLWSKQLGTYAMQMDWGTASSPVMSGESVYVQCDNDKQSFLVALDKRSGDEVWRVERAEKSNWCTPYIWKNQLRTELVAGGGSKMRSYDPATGKLLWEMAGSGRCASSPVGDDKLLFVSSADRLTGLRGIFAAIRPGASGDISLTGKDSANEFVVWSANLSGGGRVASPLLVANCLYLLEQQSGIIRCLDSQTGKQHYRQRVPGSVGATASPWSSGGNVFYLDQSGQTFVLVPGPELKVLTTNKLSDDMFWSSPAVAGNSLLLRGTDHLFCIR